MYPQRSCPYVGRRQATAAVPHRPSWAGSTTCLFGGLQGLRGACALADCEVICWRPRHWETGAKSCDGVRPGARLVLAARCMASEQRRAAVEREPGVLRLRGAAAGCGLRAACLPGRGGGRARRAADGAVDGRASDAAAAAYSEEVGRAAVSERSVCDSRLGLGRGRNVTVLRCSACSGRLASGGGRGCRGQRARAVGNGQGGRLRGAWAVGGRRSVAWCACGARWLWCCRS